MRGNAKALRAGGSSGAPGALSLASCHLVWRGFSQLFLLERLISATLEPQKWSGGSCPQLLRKGSGDFLTLPTSSVLPHPALSLLRWQHRPGDELREIWVQLGDLGPGSWEDTCALLSSS